MSGTNFYVQRHATATKDDGAGKHSQDWEAGLGAGTGNRDWESGPVVWTGNLGRYFGPVIRAGNRTNTGTGSKSRDQAVFDNCFSVRCGDENIKTTF